MDLSEKQLAQLKFEKQRASSLKEKIGRRARMLLQGERARNAKQASAGPNIY